MMRVLTMMRALLLALFFVLAPLPALAQSTEASQAATARALFQEGVALARSGDYAEATDRFRRSQALHPAAPVAYNLASALMHAGALVEATEVVEQLLRDPTLTDVLRTAGEQLRAQITPRLARLTIRLSGETEGVRVTLDALALRHAALGVPMPVDPRAHDVHALRGDEEVAHEHFELAEGESREVTLTIEAAEIPTPEVPRAAIEITPEETPTDAPPGNDDALWIGLGIGAALVGGAVATAVVLTTMPSGSGPVTGNATPGILTW
jgi:tetratricopeptide (TPR) repeat protein